MRASEPSRQKKARSNAILELLGVYFRLVDTVADARRLLDLSGANPKVTLAKLRPEEAALRTRVWDSLLRRQAARLYELSGLLLGVESIAVVNPKLQKRLLAIVGSKASRVESLNGIGAGLVMYGQFYNGTDPKWQQGVLLSMYPTRTRATIDVGIARNELEQLEIALEDFRALCAQLATPEELMRLSKRARIATKLPG